MVNSLALFWQNYNFLKSQKPRKNKYMNAFKTKKLLYFIRCKSNRNIKFHLNATWFTCFPGNLCLYLSTKISKPFGKPEIWIQTHTRARAHKLWNTLNEHPLNSTPAQLESTNKTGSGQHISLQSYNGWLYA